MKVRVTIGTLDIHEAVQAWLVDRGLPPALIGKVEVQNKNPYAGDWGRGADLRVEVEFEVDSYSSQDPKAKEA